MLGRLWGVYLGLLETQPLATKMVTSAVTFGLGDAISQAIEQRGREQELNPSNTAGLQARPAASSLYPAGFDWSRNFSFSAFGFVGVGSALHFWYGFLESRVAIAGARGVLAKMVIDQGVWAPLFTPYFFVGLGLMSREPLDKIEATVRREWWPCLVNNYKLWPAAQLVNFYVVPPQLRVLFVNCVAVVWNTYLSMIAHNSPSLSEDETKKV